MWEYLQVLVVVCVHKLVYFIASHWYIYSWVSALIMRENSWDDLRY